MWSQQSRMVCWHGDQKQKVNILDQKGLFKINWNGAREVGKRSKNSLELEPNICQIKVHNFGRVQTKIHKH